MRGFDRMKRSWWTLLLLGAVGAGCNAPPSKPPAPEAKAPATVDEIVAAHLSARGGAEKLRALRSIRESGRVTASDGRVARVVREIQRPGRFRLEFTYQGTTSVFAHDGSAGWQIAPLQGQFEPSQMPPEADSAGGSDQRDIEGPLVDWKLKGHVVTLAGREAVDGKEAFKLAVKLKEGVTRYDYVDAATFLVVRSDVTRIIRGHATMVENRFSDFRETGGILFPHAIESRIRDRPQTLRVVVDNIELDPELDAAKFKMPV